MCVVEWIPQTGIGGWAEGPATLAYSRGMSTNWTRRGFLGLLGAGVAGVLIGCTVDEEPVPEEAVEAVPELVETPIAVVPAVRQVSSPTPTPQPTPRPAGDEVRALMVDTPWETPVTIRSTGTAGPVLMVLGGVHGNEPGGWLAAERIAEWAPEVGVLAVLPRANRLAINGFLRMSDGEGDLNRQYPGDPASEDPMSRLAAEVTSLARELRADVVMDLHESWMFYVDREPYGFVSRSQAGTAYLGQTIVGGEGPGSAQMAADLASRVNAQLSREREHFVPLARWYSQNQPLQDQPLPPEMLNRGPGRSSLSLGHWVPGATPILVETGQIGQSEARRTELHLMVVREAMNLLGM